VLFYLQIVLNLGQHQLIKYVLFGFAKRTSLPGLRGPTRVIYIRFKIARLYTLRWFSIVLLLS